MASPAELSSTFLDWCKSRPGSSFSTSIHLADLSSQGRGRGIVAISDIPPNTSLFVIPRDALLSVENSDVVQKLPELFQQQDLDDLDSEHEDTNGNSLQDPWLELITVMIYEYLHRETSPWKAYLDVLPENFDSLMYWSSEELQELQASAIRNKIGRGEAEQAFEEKLLPVVTQHSDVFYPSGAKQPDDNELMELAFRMGSIIMAYAFDLDREDSDDEASDDMDEDGWMRDLSGLGSLGLVPMADMLNADAEFNAHLNHGEADLTMTSLRLIKAGEEVLNYYGPLPNSELLRRYGYTSVKHSPYDVVEISGELIRKAIHEKLGENVQLPPSDEMEDSFVLERDTDGPDETGTNTSVAAFVDFPEDLKEEVSTILAPALGIEVDNEDISSADEFKLEHNLFIIMKQALGARLKQYRTTIMEDKELLQNSKPGSRYYKAVHVRMGEKILLQEAIDFTTNALEEMDKSHGEDVGERPVKKQKLDL